MTYGIRDLDEPLGGVVAALFVIGERNVSSAKQPRT
jgi:hypothetical protein